MWSAQFAALSEEFCILAPNLNGFGDRPLTRDVLTMASLADDLARWLDTEGIQEPVVYCGLSMGGYVGWEMIARHRNRLRGMILMDTRAVPDDAATARGRELMANQVLSEGPRPLVESMWPRLFAAATLAASPPYLADVRRVMETTAPATLAAALRGMALRRDVRPQLREFDLPTLVLGGEHDVISPPQEMSEFARQLPQADYHPIPGAGHMAPLEAPEPVNALVRDFVWRQGR